MKRIRLALIGAGAMATKHARAIVRSTEVLLDVVVDRAPDRARSLALRYGATPSTDLKSAFECDAAIVATATMAHGQAALELIDAGLHVLVEKPLTGRLAETLDVINAAGARDLALMCGLVERFNPSFAQATARGGSRATHIDGVRVGPPPPRVHSSVVDDVLIHDLDLVLSLAGDDPLVDAHASAFDRVRRADWPETVTCQLSFESGLTASLLASRVARTRRRTLVIFGARHVFHVDLLESPGDPLAAQLDQFIRLIREGTATERELERNSVLACHTLVDRIEQCLAATPYLYLPM